MAPTIKESRIAVVIEALLNQATGMDYKASRMQGGQERTFQNRAEQLRRVAAHYERKHALLVIERTNPTQGEK